MDVILHLADTYLLDTLWGRVLTPASPSSPLLRHSPSLLKSFLEDESTQNVLASSAAVKHAVSGSGSESGFGRGGSLLANLTSTLVRAASSSSAAFSSRRIGSAEIASSLASASSSSSASSSLSQASASSANLALEGIDWDAISKAGLSALTRDNWVRQSISLYALTYVGILILYFLFASLSYKFLFNKEMLKHPRFLKNQVALEMQSSLAAFPVLDLLTLPWFLGEVRGHSLLYNDIGSGPGADKWWGMGGWTYALMSVPFFLVFTDACIYWVHRLEHHPRLYKHIHKPHHKWVVPTPYASHAFHPIDGYAQSLPYHIFVYVFPLHRHIYIGLFLFVNLWTIAIHDSDMICNSPLEKIINGPSHHTLHHLYFNVNYGQYFTGCDRLGGSYRAPKMEDDPLLDVQKHGEKQVSVRSESRKSK